MGKEPSRFDPRDMSEWYEKLPPDVRERILEHDRTRQRHAHHDYSYRRPRASGNERTARIALRIGAIVGCLLAIGLLGIIGLGIVAFVAGGLVFAGLLVGIGPDPQHQIPADVFIGSILVLLFCVFLLLGV